MNINPKNSIFKNKKFWFGVYNVFFWIAFLIIFVLGFWNLSKRVRTYSPFEKSILKPDIIDSWTSTLPFLIREFDLDNFSNDKNLSYFLKRMENFGIFFKE